VGGNVGEYSELGKGETLTNRYIWTNANFTMLLNYAENIMAKGVFRIRNDFTLAFRLLFTTDFPDPEYDFRDSNKIFRSGVLNRG
jgi:hypothetical protein